MTATPTRAIVLLAVAGFASQSMVRSADTLLPQIANDLAISVGAAAMVVSAYTLAHGSMQLVLGPFADRFSKYAMSALMCALSAITVAACGFAGGLGSLIAARIASGLTASWIIPLGMAYIGDAVPYERRQQVLGRYLAGQISGQLFGQASGGIVGDLFGWRATFFVHAAIFGLAALALAYVFAVDPAARIRPERRDALAPRDHDDFGSRRSKIMNVIDSHKSEHDVVRKPLRTFRRHALEGYRAVLADAWSRTVILCVFCESALMFGTFAFVGADLHLRFDLGFSTIGAIVASFAIGGLVYAASVKQLVHRIGQRGLAAGGGIVLGLAFLVLALMPAWQIAPAAVMLIGLGFYMLHNTLQTHATQMVPQARGTALGLFACALYFGQTIGVALTGQIVDRAGAPVAFFAAALLLPILGLWFARRLAS